MRLAPVTMVHRRRSGLVAAGAIVFGLSWGGAVFLSAAMISSRCCQRDMEVEFLVPIVGPAVASPPPDRGVMILWSAAQLSGAVMLYFGMKGEDVPVAHHASAAAPPRSPAFQLLPMLAPGAGGMALAARW